MNLYRAVSEQEYQQLIETHLFDIYSRAAQKVTYYSCKKCYFLALVSITPQSVEGKYFAETRQGAVQWGDLLFGSGQYRIIEVELPDDLCAQFHRWERLDRIGPARYAGIEQLRNVRVSIREVEQ